MFIINFSKRILHTRPIFGGLAKLVLDTSPPATLVTHTLKLHNRQHRSVSQVQRPESKPLKCSQQEKNNQPKQKNTLFAPTHQSLSG